MFHRVLTAAAIPVAITLLSGCSQEKMDELVASAKEKTAQITEATETVKEQVTGVASEVTKSADSAMQQAATLLPGNGRLSLQLDQEVTIGKADLQLIRVDAKRPVVIQLATYRTDRPIDSYPSALIRLLGNPSSDPLTSIDAYLNQPLSGHVFLQLEENGPIWATTDDKPIQVTLTKMDAETNLVEGSIATGQLQATDGKTQTLGGGRIIAAFAPIVDGGA